MEVRVIEDCRIRFPGGGLLVGDKLPLKCGREGIVYAASKENGREIYVVVPVEMVDEEWMKRMYAGEFQK